MYFFFLFNSQIKFIHKLNVINHRMAYMGG